MHLKKVTHLPKKLHLCRKGQYSMLQQNEAGCTEAESGNYSVYWLFLNRNIHLERSVEYNIVFLTSGHSRKAQDKNVTVPYCSIICTYGTTIIILHESCRNGLTDRGFDHQWVNIWIKSLTQPQALIIKLLNVALKNVRLDSI